VREREGDSREIMNNARDERQDKRTGRALKLKWQSFGMI